VATFGEDGTPLSLGRSCRSLPVRSAVRSLRPRERAGCRRPNEDRSGQGDRHWCSSAVCGAWSAPNTAGGLAERCTGRPPPL